MARFGFCASSSLIWGDGGLMFHFFYYVQDCRLILNFLCLLAWIIRELGDKGNWESTKVKKL